MGDCRLSDLNYLKCNNIGSLFNVWLILFTCQDLIMCANLLIYVMCFISLPPCSACLPVKHVHIDFSHLP